MCSMCRYLSHTTETAGCSRLRHPYCWTGGWYAVGAILNNHYNRMLVKQATKRRPAQHRAMSMSTLLNGLGALTSTTLGSLRKASTS